MREFGSFEGVYQAAKGDLKKSGIVSEPLAEELTDSLAREQSHRDWETLQKKGIRYCTMFHEEYPERLRSIFDPPKHLFRLGKPVPSKNCSVAIVGARDCTAYGRDMARLFAYRLSMAGIRVISGMARGIDGWAHQGALEAGKDTYAVLGSGVDVCYPSEHRRLYESIAKSGGILSEFVPGTRAKPQFFPLRNRIISALSDGLLVVEAKQRSGSLITADLALEQGKDVFVIPGRIGDPLSEGCNRLIRQGAMPVLSPEDILEYYEISTNNIEEIRTPKQQLVLDRIGESPVSLRELDSQLDLSMTEILKQILVLKENNHIREVARDCYIRK